MTVVYGILLLIAGSLPASGAADDYCRFVEGVAASESALMMWPDVFVNGGLISPGSPAWSVDDTNMSSGRLRVTAGLRYNLVEVYSATLMRRRARADCRRYRAQAHLESFRRGGGSIGHREALTAKVKMLEESLPKAEQIKSTVNDAVQRSTRTAGELDATNIRVENIRALLSESRLSLTKAEGIQSLDSELAVRAALDEYAAADGELQRMEADLRKASVWELGVRGGYDRHYGLRQKVPAMAMVNFAVSLGGLAQSGSEEQAAQGRAGWIQQQDQGVFVEAEHTLLQLSIERASEIARLNETRVLLEDLEARMKSLEDIKADKAQAYRDYVWFDLIRVRADYLYLQARVAALEVFFTTKTASP